MRIAGLIGRLHTISVSLERAMTSARRAGVPAAVVNAASDLHAYVPWSKTMHIRTMGYVMALATTLAGVSHARADIVLTDQNSVVSIAPFGAASYFVNGVNNLFQQSFWYRTSPTAPEANITALGTPAMTSTANTATLVYEDQSLQTSVNFQLEGTSGNASTLSESVVLKNMSSDRQLLTFFVYTDWDIGGQPGNGSAFLAATNSIVQTSNGSTATVSVSPNPDHWEIDYYANTLSKLDDDSPTTLSDSTSPLSNGDLTSAFQWDLVLEGNASVTLTITKQIDTLIPEPASLSLLGAGALAALAMRRRPR